jgi:hypothetical protein
MPVTTLLDIAKANGSDAAVGLIEEVMTYSPEVSLGAARTIKGLSYKTLVRTNLPTAAFRNANEGVAATKSTWENRVVECFTLNPRWECDKAVADRYEDGAQAFIALEADGIMRAAMLTLGSQFYYGTSNDAKGFPGLLAAYDATNMVVDAGGTTASTGSSVWGVKWGPKAVQWVYGTDGQLSVSDVSEQRVLDASNNPYTAYVQELLAYPGLQATSEGEMPTGVELQRLLDAAAGLTRFEAENAYSLSLVLHSRLEVQTLWELKSQMLKKSGLMQLHRGTERFDDLGGLEALKTFCKRALRRSSTTQVKPRGVLLLSPPGCPPFRLRRTYCGRARRRRRSTPRSPSLS